MLKSSEENLQKVKQDLRNLEEESKNSIRKAFDPS